MYFEKLTKVNKGVPINKVEIDLSKNSIKTTPKIIYYLI